MAGTGTSQPDDGQRLAQLGLEFTRQISKARRQDRRLGAAQKSTKPSNLSSAGEQWSRTVDSALEIAELIARQPATDLDGLVVKFDAIWWWLEQDDSVLDAAAKRWLRGFRRALQRLARS